MLRHIDNRHRTTVTASETGRMMGNGFCTASGLKQLKVIKALYGDDCVHGTLRVYCLHHSSELLRMDGLNTLSIDRYVGLLLDTNGPRYVVRSLLGSVLYVRWVGYT